MIQLFNNTTGAATPNPNQLSGTSQIDWDFTLSQLPEAKLLRIQRELAFYNDNKERFNLLSKRQVEVLQLICSGLSTKQVAGVLYIANGTARKHRNNIYKVLEIGTVQEAMSYGLAFDLV